MEEAKDLDESVQKAVDGEDLSYVVRRKSETSELNWGREEHGLNSSRRNVD